MRARRTDPATSKRAAANASHFIGPHRQRIKGAIREHGPQSPRALETLTGLSVVQIDRRRKEMILAGELRVLTRRGCPVIDRGCEVLALGVTGR